MSDTVRTSRRLYISALADAIDWTESLLATHDPAWNGATACCKPSARCEHYQQTAKLLADYRRAYTRVRGGPSSLETALDDAEAVQLHELAPSEHFTIGGDDQ